MSDPLPSIDDTPSRIARAMAIGAWAVALVLLVMLFGSLTGRDSNPNPRPSSELGANGVPQVVLARNRAGHYVAGGRINGEPVVFMLDTGATDVALPLGVARRLGLPLRPGAGAVTANGVVETWGTRLDTVDLGGLVLRDVRASVLPAMPGEEVLLGMSYLKHLELVQRGDTLTLRPPR